MKSYDSLIPYILASMHPLGHMTLLATGLLLNAYDPDNFYENTGTCKPKTEAFYFQTDGKYWYMFYIMTAHLAAVILHYGRQLANHYNLKTIANLMLVSKVLGYLYVVMMVQNGIDYTYCSEITDKMPVMAWLTYEVSAFYFNLLGLMIFLVVASFKKFRTMREREGFAGNMRKTQDFLSYCKEDVHWFQIWFLQVGLFTSGMLFRGAGDLKDSIGVATSESAALLLFGLFLMVHIYFGEDKFKFTSTTYILLGATFVIACAMINRFLVSMQENRIWWAPVVLEMIVAHMLIYVQMGIEYCTWTQKKLGW